MKELGLHDIIVKFKPNNAIFDGVALSIYDQISAKLYEGRKSEKPARDGCAKPNGKTDYEAEKEYIPERMLVCAGCQKLNMRSAMKVCSCKQSYYCNRDCQKAD